MSNRYIVSVDPAELCNRFSSNKDNPEEIYISLEEGGELSGASKDDDEPFAVSSSYEEKVKPLLGRLPEREQDLIDLYFIKRKRQSDIAKIFGVTQAAPFSLSMTKFLSRTSLNIFLFVMSRQLFMRLMAMLAHLS